MNIFVVSLSDLVEKVWLIQRTLIILKSLFDRNFIKGHGGILERWLEIINFIKPRMINDNQTNSSNLWNVLAPSSVLTK